MVRKNVILSLLILGGFFMGCKESDQPKETIKVTPIEFKKEGEAYILKASGDTLSKIELEIADDAYQRETGLMYRESMAMNRGMLFIFDTEEQLGFYMKNTYIPLDLIFLNKDLIIVNIQKNATPKSLETIPSNAPAQYVLEVNAGLTDTWNLSKGDKIILNRF